MNERTWRVGIIGGGLGGLAAACTLAARGYDVVLFEKNAWLGGKAAVLEADGFRFDMGPTILTLPEVLARIFAEAGRELRDELDLIPLELQWRCFFSDGGRLDLHSDPAVMAEHLRQFAPGPDVAAAYRRFLDWSAELDAIARKNFFWRPVVGFGDLFQPASLVRPGFLREVLAMKLGQTVGGAIRNLAAEPRLAQMLDHFTQYVGSSPEASPAALCGIGHMQVAGGVWYPRGGTAAIPHALAQLAIDLGVEVRLETGVRQILLDAAGAVSGVETDGGERIPLQAVLSNADSVLTHRDLLAGNPSRRFARRWQREPACSGVVLYLGLERRYDHLAHHNFIFSRDPHEEFKAIYERGEPAPDPTCYVCAPARTDPDVAPPGGEALYVLVHTPYLRPGDDWKRMLPAYREIIMRKLETCGQLDDLRERIRFEDVLTPQDIHDRYRVLNGAIYGLSSHGRWLGAFKPANRSPDVRGLYFAGGAAHPGPGMPMVLMSGWIAADCLDQDCLRTKTRRESLLLDTGGAR